VRHFSSPPIVRWHAPLAFSDASTFHYAYTRVLRNGAVVRTKTWREVIPRDCNEVRSRSFAVILDRRAVHGNFALRTLDWRMQGPKCENEAFYGLPSPDGLDRICVSRKCAAKVAVTTGRDVLDFTALFERAVMCWPWAMSSRTGVMARSSKLLVTVCGDISAQSRVGSITVEFRAENRSGSRHNLRPVVRQKASSSSGLTA